MMNLGCPSSFYNRMYKIVEESLDATLYVCNNNLERFTVAKASTNNSSSIYFLELQIESDRHNIFYRVISFESVFCIWLKIIAIILQYSCEN